MYIILGANGHIGSVTADTLLNLGEKVTVIIRDGKNQKDWETKGAKVEIADVYDTAALNKIFNKGTRLFILNPPADPSTDTVEEESKTVNSIIKALNSSTIKKVVAQSVFGAQKGTGIGDLGVLYDMEQMLAKKKDISTTIIRGSYYMSNWDAALQTAAKEGIVNTLYPADFKLPMVAPYDIGQAVAHHLTEPVKDVGIYIIEGPESYSSADVAAAFSKALNKSVKAVTTPKKQWIPVLKSLGYSETAAKSMVKMTEMTLESNFDIKENHIIGPTSLESYIANLVSKSK